MIHKFAAVAVLGFGLCAANNATAFGSGFSVQHSQHAQHKVQVGKYEVELRVPAEGLYAGAETDVEFRVSDTTQKDPVESGFKGVANVKARGVVTMPSMQGMPPAHPSIHREGVPGDYGVALYFPHGGDFQLDLLLTPPGEKEFRASFAVSVADEKPAATKVVAPYVLKVLNWPAHAMAGKVQNLKVVVIDSKSGKPQTEFDVAHTMRMHLLLASKDLGWFTHEHPSMAADGTWTLPFKFPAGGTYWVYADVAPKGQGSRVLISQVKVYGAKQTWKSTFSAFAGPARDRDLTGYLASTVKPIPVGKTVVLKIRLFDTATGKPAGDTQDWLGAAGHLMIFHKDGRTVVHSHPQDGEAMKSLVKKGQVLFNARFPKAGLYKAYAQFQRGGKVHTLSFGILVK